AVGGDQDRPRVDQAVAEFAAVEVVEHSGALVEDVGDQFDGQLPLLLDQLRQAALGVLEADRRPLLVPLGPAEEAGVVEGEEELVLLLEQAVEVVGHRRPGPDLLDGVALAVAVLPAPDDPAGALADRPKALQLHGPASPRWWKRGISQSRQDRKE